MASGWASKGMDSIQPHWELVPNGQRQEKLSAVPELKPLGQMVDAPAPAELIPPQPSKGDSGWTGLAENER
jgi:hypothetical protein